MEAVYLMSGGFILLTVVFVIIMAVVTMKCEVTVTEVKEDENKVKK